MTEKKVINGTIIKDSIAQKDLVNLGEYCDDLKGITIDMLRDAIRQLDDNVDEVSIKSIYFDEIGVKDRYERRTISFEYVLDIK
jgi:hypothetical protein